MLTAHPYWKLFKYFNYKMGKNVICEHNEIPYNNRNEQTETTDNIEPKRENLLWTKCVHPKSIC